MRAIFLIALFFSVNCFAATGTGFIISNDGYIVTSFHVVDKSSKIYAKAKDGKSYQAVLVRSDPNNDIAVIKIIGNGFKPVSILSSAGILRGEKVYTMGFPQTVIQGTEPKLTDGIVSSLTGIKDEPSSFQITNPIQPGNSGGPLFTEDGFVIGIINSTLSPTATLKITGSLPQNVNFATKSNYLIELLNTVDKTKFKTSTKSKQQKKLTSIIADIEESIVFISTSEEQIAKKPTQPLQASNIPQGKPPQANVPSQTSLPSAPQRTVSIVAPNVVDNGAVTPVGISFSPPLRAGDTAYVRINKQLASKIDVVEGTLNAFNTRFIFNETYTVVEVTCNNCEPQIFRSDVRLIAPLQSSNSSPQPQMRMAGSQGDLKVLVGALHTTSGFVKLNGSGLKVNVLLTPFTVRDPFYNFKGSILKGMSCIQFNTASESKGCIDISN
jgi:hypothetical protein